MFGGFFLVRSRPFFGLGVESFHSLVSCLLQSFGRSFHVCPVLPPLGLPGQAEGALGPCES